MGTDDYPTSAPWVRRPRRVLPAGPPSGFRFARKAKLRTLVAWMTLSVIAGGLGVCLRLKDPLVLRWHYGPERV